MPVKKGKADDSKGKEAMPPLEAKKRSIKGASKGSIHQVAPGEGTLAVLGHSLGLRAFVMASASMAEKFLTRVILSVNKEKVDKLSFDQVVTKFLHILDQVFIHFYPRF